MRRVKKIINKMKRERDIKKYIKFERRMRWWLKEWKVEKIKKLKLKKWLVKSWHLLAFDWKNWINCKIKFFTILNFCN